MSYYTNGKAWSEIVGERPKKKSKSYIPSDPKLAAIHTNGGFIRRGKNKAKGQLEQEIKDFYKQHEIRKRNLHHDPK